MRTATAPAPATIVLQLQGRRHEIAYHPGDTVLETARRAGLAAPYSCEAGSCATCMALLHEGSVTMRTNNALTPDEVDGGVDPHLPVRADGPVDPDRVRAALTGRPTGITGPVRAD